jgi:hypothetical protein
MKDDFALTVETCKPASWLPTFAGGLLLVGGVVTAIFDGKEAVDFCRVGFTNPVAACEPANLPPADLPHHDHAPATTRNIAVVATSTSSTSATPSITVAPTSQ